jgi:1-aminocyclopropane-1-carboxylate deaminase/D-cysteine desulfhydrase-like pyridoxal-dependent ACC family enzyme
MTADAARRALGELPPRQPKRLLAHNLQGLSRNRFTGVETVKWLHSVHGDPITGKDRRQFKLEEAAEREAEAGEADGDVAEEREDYTVVIEDPARHAMPLAYLDGLSETEFAATSQLAKDCMVVTRWEVHGTHSGELLGVQPTKREVTFAGMTVLAFKEELPAEDRHLLTATDEWTYWDLPSLMEQIGATP